MDNQKFAIAREQHLQWQCDQRDSEIIRLGKLIILQLSYEALEDKANFLRITKSIEFTKVNIAGFDAAIKRLEA